MFEPKNEKVNIEVTNLAKDRGLDSFWLGINDKSQENNFVYASDGSPITYENWCGPDCCSHTHGEPSGNGDCVWVDFVYHHSCSDHSVWDDEPCSNVKPFVCEKGELGLDYIMSIRLKLKKNYSLNQSKVSKDMVLFPPFDAQISLQ